MKKAFKVTIALLLVVIVLLTARELWNYKLNSAVRKLVVAQRKLNEVYLRDKKYPKTYTVEGFDDGLYSYSSSNGYFYIDCTIKNFVSDDTRLTMTPVSINRKEDQDGRSEALYVDLSILRDIANMDPKKEIAKAMANKDFRFVAVYGYSKTVPGIDDYYEKYESIYGDWAIPGTGDCVYDFALQKKAELFATKYNQLLRGLIRYNILRLPDKSM